MKKIKQIKLPENTKEEITGQKHNIHTHLYKFRFLNTQQIQILLNHKSKTYINNDWLTDLTKEKYIKRYYTGKMRLAGLPAIYSLGLKGRKHLKSLRDTGSKEFRLSELDRVYKEEGLSLAFKIKCMSLADICLSLIKLTEKNNAKLSFYTKVDLKYMKDLIDPAPDAYFAIEEKNKSIKRYFLDYIDLYLPQDKLEARIRHYINYFKGNQWQNNTGYPFPQIIIIVSNNSLKTSMHKYIVGQLNEKSAGINFYLSTRQEIKQYGIKRETLHIVK